MKLFIVLFVFTWLNCGSCNKTSPEYQHDDNCTTLIERAYQEDINCTFMTTYHMKDAMFELWRGNDEKAIQFCNLVPAGANCVLDNLPNKIPDDCKSVNAYVSKITMSQHDKSYAEYYCANDMQHLKDRSRLDGRYCLYGQTFNLCRFHPYGQVHANATIKDKLCGENHLIKMCSEHWDTCDNQKVRDIEYGLFDILHEAMECPPQE